MTEEYGPFPQPLWQEICQYQGNHKCCDCSSLDTDWASVSHGTLICLDCAGKHRSLGVHVSFVRSIRMDTWNKEQIEMMRQGGNAQIRDFFGKVNIDDTVPIVQLYTTKGAGHYRASLKERVSKILSGEICASRRVQKPALISEETQAREQHRYELYYVMFPAGSLGLTLSQDVMGTATVKKIVAGSAAENLGVLIDDKVVAVGGQSTPYFDEALQGLAKGPRPLHVTFSRLVPHTKPPTHISPRNHGSLHISPRSMVGGGSTSSTPKHTPHATPRGSARPSPRTSPKTSPKSSPTATTKKIRSPNNSISSCLGEDRSFASTGIADIHHSSLGAPNGGEHGQGRRTPKHSPHPPLVPISVQKTASSNVSESSHDHKARKFTFSQTNLAEQHHLETIAEAEVEQTESFGKGQVESDTANISKQLSGIIHDRAGIPELSIQITPSMDALGLDSNESNDSVVLHQDDESGIDPSGYDNCRSFSGLNRSIDELDESFSACIDHDNDVVNIENVCQLEDLVANGFAELIKAGMQVFVSRATGWYPAELRKCHNDGTFKVRYHNGRSESRIPASRLAYEGAELDRIQDLPTIVSDTAGPMSRNSAPNVIRSRLKSGSYDSDGNDPQTISEEEQQHLMEEAMTSIFADDNIMPSMLDSETTDRSESGAVVDGQATNTNTSDFISNYALDDSIDIASDEDDFGKTTVRDVTAEDSHGSDSEDTEESLGASDLRIPDSVKLKLHGDSDESEQPVCRDYRVQFMSSPLGLTLTQTLAGTAEVTRVVEQGQAARLGVNAGDILVGINTTWINGYQEAMQYLSAGTFPVSVVFRRTRKWV